MSEYYKAAGVDIDAGNEAVKLMKQHVARTMRPEVKTDLGGFGGLFALAGKYEKPILVAGTDGVGTKLKIAIEMDQHDTVGIDLVAMSVNDIVVQGAEPLFFLDYIATGKLIPEQVEQIVAGIADGCVQAGCALIGGETAEMAGMYADGEYDLAGFAVGVVEEDRVVTGASIESGNVIVGLASNGVHSNGYSLVRHLLFTKHDYHINAYVPSLDNTLGTELLKPTRIYVKPVLELLKRFNIKGMAHITGGGFIENIPRILPENLQAKIKLGSWEVPKIFKLLAELGEMDDYNLYRTFNMGIGYIIVVNKDEANEVVQLANELGETATIIGKITKGEKGVILS
jgi:phosphoribosylformylglycinamidine cyclo-ligase